MARVPLKSIPSIAQTMQSLRIEDKTEKGLLVRIGVLIDAIVEAQRGLANPGQGSRRANVNNLKKPNRLTGSTENLFNAVSVNINPSNSAANLSHHEVQIDSNENFRDPTQKNVFGTSTTFKGLLEGGLYNIRIRPVTKDGQVGDWTILDPVSTTESTTVADLDGAKLGEVAVSKNFTIGDATQEVFCSSALGFQYIDTGNGGEDDLSDETAFALKDREGDAGVYTDIETISFPGVAMAISSGFGNNEFLTRMNPIVFFTLITPDVATFPDTRNYDVQISEASGAFGSHTEDTVWVEF